MELTQLKYFRAVSRHEHFTRAAEELHVAQPSLSRAIANLEEELGVPLFDRDSRNVHLNGYGRAFARRVERILAEVDEASAEIRDMREGMVGELNIASSFLLEGPGELADFIRRFYLDNPNVYMHIFYTNMPAMTEMLHSRRVDFALSAHPFHVPEIEERTLYSYRLGLVMNRNHPLASRRSVRMEELSQYAFLSNNSSPDLQDTIYEVCAKAGFRPKIAFECDNSDLIGEAVSRGYGISFATEQRFLYNERIQKNEHSWKEKLVFVPVEDDFCVRTTRIAFLKGRYQTAAAQFFLQELLSCVSGVAADSAGTPTEN